MSYAVRQSSIEIYKKPCTPKPRDTYTARNRRFVARNNTMVEKMESIFHTNDKLGNEPEWNAVEVHEDELVEDKYQGTAADRHDMRMLGRIQVLRVGAAQSI